MTEINEKPPVVSSRNNVIYPVALKSQTKPQSTLTIKTKPIRPLNAWDRMVNLYALKDYDNNRVNRELAWYLNHPKYLKTIQQRAEAYLYIILDEIERNNIPGELALLPVVESAFLPYAYSRSKASGLWQFIPATGRLYGLKQNWWYDGRRDVYASTKAATRFLRELSITFNGDWLLALASYNAGKGTVGKAIRKNRRNKRPSDYWSLRLPKETMRYVPKLLAIAKIFANPDRYNIKLHPIANEPVFEAINIGSQLDLAKAADMAKLPMDDFFKFNPGFNRWCTDPKGPHRLLIPVEHADLFKINLAKLPKNDRMSWKRHKIKPGENLGKISRKHNTTVKMIRQVNNLKSNRIRAGHYLLIPNSRNAQKLNPYNTKPARKKHGKIIYIVKRGDTFWDIARKYSVSSKKIASWNKLTLKSILRPGQRLVIHRGNNRKIAATSIDNGSNHLEYLV